MPFEDQLPYALPVEQTLESLHVSPDQGLSDQEVRARQHRHGLNLLEEKKPRGAGAILLDQLKSVVVLILAAAAVLAFVSARWAEGIAVLAVIGVNTLIGFFAEWRAVRSMEALRKMGETRVRVRRGGREAEVPSEELVPGDVVLQEAGDVVPADLRLIEASGMRVNEAALTGESVPADKRLDPVDPDAPLAERTDMLYKGTTIVEGSGEGVVTGTGMETELGRISQLAEEAEKESTPLQRRLNQLGARLAWITLALAAVVAGAGIAAGQETVLMIETAIALGVAAIPEGLPIVATIALARGMWHMARRNALVNRLPAVETLGATRVIFTDKTGTLTQNRMTLRRVLCPSGDYQLDPAGGESPDSDPLLRRILEVGVLCNNASLGEEEDQAAALGDPTEAALLEAGLLAEFSRERLLQEKPEVREESFDPEVMMMATYHESGGGIEVAVKGAPGAVLEVCDSIASENGEGSEPLTDSKRQHWFEQTEALAGEGLRLLAIADKRVDNAGAEPYQGLRLLGLVGLFDPPGEGVKESIDACRAAGIRVVMVTGDQPATARAIGRRVGLVDSDEDASVIHGRDLQPPEELSEEDRKRLLATRIFARVNPEQKLDLVRLYQQAGETVAMTGDGINDAPALKKADIGVAMGRRGTDAAKQVADMVLKDDSLSSIVVAVRQGRIIFGNIRKSAIFMLCTNVAEILAVAGASLANIPLPLRPLQILYLNILTDVFPALALAVGPGPPEIMQQPPRPPKESILTRRHWLAVAGWSLVIAMCVMAALGAGLLWLELKELAAVTVSFLTLGFAKLWFVFNLRDRGSRLLTNDIVRNRWIWGSIVLCAGLLLAAVYLPGLSHVLQTRSIGGSGWAVVLGLSIIPTILGQTLRAFQRRRPPAE